MPRLQDIERFKRDLAALSHEAEVLERWGEKPEVIPPPEGAGAPGLGVPEEAAEAATPVEEGIPPDFADLLDNMPVGGEKDEAAPDSMDDELAALLGSIGGDEAPSEPAEEPEAMPQPSEMPDLDLFATEAKAPGAEPGGPPSEEKTEAFDFELPDFGPGSAEGSTEGPAASEAQPSEAESFGTESFGTESFGTEAASFGEELEAKGLVSLPEAPAEEAAKEETFDLGMEGFELPGGAPAGLEGGAEEGGSEELAPLESALTPMEGETPSAPEELFSIPEFSAELSGESEGPAAESAPEEGLSLGEAEPGAGLGNELGTEGGKEFGTDAFETFSFEEGGGAEDFGIGSLGAEGSGRDLDKEIAALSEEAPVADTFKIDQDWGEFGAFGTGQAAAPKREAPPRPKRESPRATEEKFKPVSLSEAQVDRLQDSLLSFPLNLRVAIEDILANDRGTEAQQSKLVWALVDSMAAEDVALLAGRILKRHIPIPKGKEKRTGAALEAERGTLAYAFIHTFLPVLRIGLVVLAAAMAIGYLGWRYVYVPLAADSLYREGYRRIAQERFPEAETDFAKATSMREFIAWYYRYAEAYAAKRQYILAEKKYASLIEAHPKEKMGILDWARLEKEQLKFEEAVEVLKGAPRSAKADAVRGMTGLLSWDYFNENGLLLLGDVYLDWADETPAKYEDARRTYATLIEHYGDKDVFLERMLKYFIRTDKLGDVLPLKSHFLAEPKREGIGAGTLSELGGYLLDKNMLEEVRDILLTAAKKDPAEPEAHYQLARYFRRAGDPIEERKALDNAVRSFSALPGLGGRRAGMYIDSLIWRGRYLVEAKEWLSAERDFAAAAGEYEKALELRRVQKGGRFGEAYAGLADVAYWQRDDLAAALGLYDRAAENGYATQDTAYKRGNILYRMGRYAECLESFYEAGAKGSMSPYLAYAFGSALYARHDLFSAEAYFRKSAAAMEKELSEDTVPMPQERPSEIEILRLYMQSENNLGVALYRSAARSGDARRRNLAMVALTHSVKLYDQLSQAPEALEGPEPRNLGLQNMNTLLTSGKGDNLAVYAEIEKDMKFPKRG